MKRLFILIALFIQSAQFVWADYSSHGRPWDADDNYDSSRGIWFILFVIVIGIIVIAGAAAKNVWDKHKDSVKEVLGGIAFFGGICILFLIGKQCSESNHNNTSTQQNYAPQNPVVQPQNLHTVPNSKVNNQQPYQPQLRYRTEEYFETCSYCNGSGLIPCPKCGGTGWLKSKCSFCNGTGNRHRVRCLDCIMNEQAGLPSSYCISCGNTGYVDTYCQRCDGSGYESNMCTYCDLYEHKVQCNHCNGYGKIRKTRQVQYYE